MLQPCSNHHLANIDYCLGLTFTFLTFIVANWIYDFATWLYSIVECRLDL